MIELFNWKVYTAFVTALVDWRIAVAFCLGVVVGWGLNHARW